MEMTSGRGIDIEPGAAVYGSDGEKLGAIMEIGPDYIVVEKGLFFPTDYFVPNGAVASVEPDRITLTLTRDEALEQGWDKDPTEHPDEPVAPRDADPDRFTGDFDGAAVTGFGPAAESERGDPVKSGFATEVGTTPPAADFNTLGVAPVDVNTSYTAGNIEPADRADPATDQEPIDQVPIDQEPNDGQRQDRDQS